MMKLGWWDSNPQPTPCLRGEIPFVAILLLFAPTSLLSIATTCLPSYAGRESISAGRESSQTEIAFFYCPETTGSLPFYRENQR
jgi:hypothetical protein